MRGEGMRQGSVPARVLRWLQGRSGWVATDDLVRAIYADPETVKRALYRLRTQQLIESRRVEWVRGREWRAVQ